MPESCRCIATSNDWLPVAYKKASRCQTSRARVFGKARRPFFAVAANTGRTALETVGYLPNFPRNPRVEALAMALCGARISTRYLRVLARLAARVRKDSSQLNRNLESPMSKLRPLHDRVIVKRLEEERVSAGGIVIPDSATEKPTRGKVIAAGTGLIQSDGKVRPMSLKEGDVVLFGKYAGQEIKIDGEDLVFLKEDDIVAVIEG